MSQHVVVEVPEQAVKLFDGDASRFGREMYEAAVAQWYDEGRISSGKGAELLGVGRAEFLEVLRRHKVSPFQYSAQELAAELRGA